VLRPANFPKKRNTSSGAKALSFSGHFVRAEALTHNPELRLISGTEHYQVVEKLLSFVGRAFRHDKKFRFSSGVLTPEGLKPHLSANS
jgi:hypothetical protein